MPHTSCTQKILNRCTPLKAQTGTDTHIRTSNSQNSVWYINTYTHTWSYCAVSQTCVQFPKWGSLHFPPLHVKTRMNLLKMLYDNKASVVKVYAEIFTAVWVHTFHQTKGSTHIHTYIHRHATSTPQRRQQQSTQEILVTVLWFQPVNWKTVTTFSFKVLYRVGYYYFICGIYVHYRGVFFVRVCMQSTPAYQAKHRPSQNPYR